MITLRPYQQQAVDLVRDSYRKGCKRVCLTAATGAGKTVMFCYMAKYAVQKGNRVLVLVHRAELLDQAARSMSTFGLPHGVIAAGRPMNQIHPVQIASVQTIVNRLAIVIPPDFIIVDECHHSVSDTYTRVFDAFPKATKILGVTATPERLDGKGLGDVYEDLVLGPQPAELIENGFLSKPIYYAPPVQFSLDGVYKTAGDYNKGELNEVMSKPSITGDCVEKYREILKGEPSIAFCVSVQHAKDTAEAFRQAGYTSECIDGKMNPIARRRLIEDLGARKLNVLTSCDLIGEGVDVPIVVGAILLRPTQSLGLHLQQIGRVLRTAHGKENAVILDHVGNLKRHGFAETYREWNLEGYAAKRKHEKDKGEDSRFRQCSECYCCHEPAPVCPRCGFVYPVKSREIEVVNGDLIQVSAESLKQAEQASRRQEQGMAKTYTDLLKLAKQRGYKNPHAWANYVSKGRKAG